MNTNFTQAQAKTEPPKTYKTNIYSMFNYTPTKDNHYGKAYGLGVESYLLDTTKILCRYQIANIYVANPIEKDGKKYIKKQKAEDLSHIIALGVKHYSNNFIFKASLGYARLSAVFKFYDSYEKNAKVLSVGDKIDQINITTGLAANYNINDKFYVSPQFNITFVRASSEHITNTLNPTINKATKSKDKKAILKVVTLSPEIAIGTSLALADNASINPEVVFNYAYNINNPSKGDFSINASIRVDVARIYCSLAVDSITEEDDISVSMKFGVRF